MIYLGGYRSYLLDQVGSGMDINTSSGSRYIRNSVLIFRPAEPNPVFPAQAGVIPMQEA